MAPITDLPPFDISSSTSLPRDAYTYEFPIPSDMTCYRMHVLGEATSLIDVDQILRSKSATTYYIQEDPLRYSYMLDTNESLDADFDVFVPLPMKKSLTVKAKVKAVSRFIPNISVD